jgi:hypothetical protein
VGGETNCARTSVRAVGVIALTKATLSLGSGAATAHAELIVLLHGVNMLYFEPMKVISRQCCDHQSVRQSRRSRRHLDRRWYQCSGRSCRPRQCCRRRCRHSRGRHRGLGCRRSARDEQWNDVRVSWSTYTVASTTSVAGAAIGIVSAETTAGLASLAQVNDGQYCCERKLT